MRASKQELKVIQQLIIDDFNRDSLIFASSQEGFPDNRDDLCEHFAFHFIFHFFHTNGRHLI